jgi:hypothetical protein
MTNEQKRQVRDALVRYVNNFDTQSEAAASLDGISASTISQVKNNNWELLSDRLWHHIARQVGFFCGEWQPGDTSTYLLLRILFGDAQHFAMTYGIAINKGLGKTFTAHHYTRENENVIYLPCNGEYNRKSFMIALMHAAGLLAKGSVPDMMKVFATAMTEKENAVLILDDADQLKDRVLHLVVMLINSVAGNAGTVIMGSDQLRSRIVEGVRLKKIGFDEIYKSIGRRFITLAALAPRDVELVCRANGLYYETMIAEIAAECSDLHQAVHLIREKEEMKIAA